MRNEDGGVKIRITNPHPPIPSPDNYADFNQ
jgi:hypothetical protein